MCSNSLGSQRLAAPTGEVVTDYDRAHFRHYIQLLDAHSAGVDSDIMCRSILDIDPDKDPEDAHRILESHLDRAVWMSKIGFRQI